MWRPWLVISLGALLAGLLAVDGWLFVKRVGYEREISRLRGGMTSVERRKADLEFAANKDRLQVTVALIRRQGRGDRALHLAVAVDSGVMYLSQERALLRAMPVRVGPDRLVGKPPDTVRVAAPRGTRTIAAIAADTIMLSGGTEIYADSHGDRLDDAAGVSPGNVRAKGADLRAILPVLSPGMNVYLY
jgi:hypothetical protein